MASLPARRGKGALFWGDFKSPPKNNEALVRGLCCGWGNITEGGGCSLWGVVALGVVPLGCGNSGFVWELLNKFRRAKYDSFLIIK